MRRSLLYLTVLLSVPLAASAQGRWKEIGTTSVGNPVSVDTRSVAKAGDIVTATVRVRFVKPVKIATGEITSSRTVAMFDCAKRTVAVKENTYFLDERANRVAQRTVVGKPGYGSPIKGTLPDVAMRYLCPG
jgi:hypothetical protein